MDSSPRTQPLYRGTQIVWYALSVLAVLLAFRFAFKFLGANPEAGFTTFIYALSYPFVVGFESVFGILAIRGAVFEWTTFLAMVVYWLFALLIIRLFVMSKPVSTLDAAVKLNTQDPLRY